MTNECTTLYTEKAYNNASKPIIIYSHYNPNYEQKVTNVVDLYYVLV